jgi:hypothetical protein
MIKLAINDQINNQLVCLLASRNGGGGGGGLREARLHILNLARDLHTLLINVGVCGLSCLYRIEERELPDGRMRSYIFFCFSVFVFLEGSRRF